ncbi:hypothetical protein [Pedobacter panaciterrae]
MSSNKNILKAFYLILISSCLFIYPIIISFKKDGTFWKSKFLNVNKDGSITYIPDENGNTIPDFSNVGYHHGLIETPDIKVVKNLNPVQGDAGKAIQQAIDEVAALAPDRNGYRGAILLKKGSYPISGSISIQTSGIILRGEGGVTKLIATGKGQRSLIKVSGKGKVIEVKTAG